MLFNIRIANRTKSAKYGGTSGIAAFLDVHDECEVVSVDFRTGKPDGFEQEIVITIEVDELTDELEELIHELVTASMASAGHLIDRVDATES